MLFQFKIHLDAEKRNGERKKMFSFFKNRRKQKIINIFQFTGLMNMQSFFKQCTLNIHDKFCGRRSTSVSVLKEKERRYKIELAIY